MKTAHRRAAQHKRRWQKDPTAAFKLLGMAKPNEPGKLDTEHIECRVSFERLRDGGATEQDFDLVAHVLNSALVRAEQIDELLVETIKRGQDAMVRMKDRYLRGLRFGFDAPGLRDVPAALDAWEAMADASSPLQLQHAIKEAYRRMTGGQLLKLEDVQ
ncbi:MAG: hypothetical protein E6Q78_05090 [Rhodoferax sp.]|nr:MAG: hypothetical protein E6Q78_05090 [Rhodoferax sp.]